MCLGEVAADNEENVNEEAVSDQTGTKGAENAAIKDIKFHGDESEIRQLTAILLDNAVKYCDEGGSIKAVLNQKKHPVLTVTNSCKNVDNIKLDRLFDRFYREDTARTAGSGFGIGLSIAQSIAERHKGSIKAVKAADGVIGFTVKL